LRANSLFPKAVDQHKPNKPLIPNGLGVVYVLVSAVFLFLLYNLGYSGALPLAGCILFGGFMGLLDDWIDLRWRYKAFLPIFASLPLVVERRALGPEATQIATYIFGKVDFDMYFFIVIIPLIIAVVTNTVNQLGGLNGLETVCPSIVMIGLMVTSPRTNALLFVPLAVNLILAYLNFTGRVFVGNTGSFATGITLASYAIIANNEQTLLISILPYVFNSSLILLTVFITGKTAHLVLKDGRLQSDHRRSLLTLLAYHRPSSERRLVLLVSLLVFLSTLASVLVWLKW
jgi:UDP-N-acetylglucosamine--dolichyl-phosphate N-acetylglucosaminephosphotransferase